MPNVLQETAYRKEELIITTGTGTEMTMPGIQMITINGAEEIMMQLGGKIIPITGITIVAETMLLLITITIQQHLLMETGGTEITTRKVKETANAGRMQTMIIIQIHQPEKTGGQQERRILRSNKKKTIITEEDKMRAGQTGNMLSKIITSSGNNGLKGLHPSNKGNRQHSKERWNEGMTITGISRDRETITGNKIQVTGKGEMEINL